MTGNGSNNSQRGRRRRRRRPRSSPAGEGSQLLGVQGQQQQGGGHNAGAASQRRPARRRRRHRRGRVSAAAPTAAQPQARPQGDATLAVRGVLQVEPVGHGFLRRLENDYNPAPDDPFVPKDLIERLGLESGVEVEGLAVPAPGSRRGPWLEQVVKLQGETPERWHERRPFKDLVAEAPTERIRLETTPEEVEMRVVDLIAPIGKGQRCLIVAPPKAGKTVLLQKMAQAITTNHPEIHLIVLLIDERPEEVTDMRRNVKGEVVASSSDELARNHVQVAEIVLERAKRLVEGGRDVVVLLDSITRLSRAYNTEQRSSGRVLSGGIDARTMEKPRRFFGAARKAEGGGSLTVIGTALVDTGSRMDEVIFQEFKGTGNTEIVLDRKLFEQRIFPSIDISQTGTRKEELLYTPDEYKKVTVLRRALSSLKPDEAMRLLVGKLRETRSNADFLASLAA